MKKSHKNLIFVVLLSLMGSAHFACAQSLDTLDEITDFKLNSDIEKKDTSSVLSNSERFSEEFKLSLGSQILSYPNTNKVYSSETKHIETGFSGLNVDIKLDDSNLNINDQKELTPLITLNNSYEDNAIGFGESSSPTLSLYSKTGKLSFYGRYNQSNLSISSGEQQSSEKAVGSVRASSTSNDLLTEDDNSSNPSSISSDYYLEAVYNFKPNVKGKVTYKKTVLDTLDLKENVEVEGIVDVTKDVSIKASYQNESRPELEKKTSGEKKILTEFILKF